MFSSEEEFKSWAKSINLSDQAIAIIKNIRESDPARRVRSGAYNVGGRFARSRKMSHTIQHESKTVEFPALLMMELDYIYAEDDVIEIWDQPPSFVINYKAANDRNTGHNYTADFFVVRRNSAGWEEWKAEQKLYKEFKKNPAKYYQDEEKIWHFPPGKNYASTFGLYFHVHSSAEINWTLHRNLKLLLPIYNSEFDCSSPIHKEILQQIRFKPGLRLSEIKESVKKANNLHIYQLLITKNIFIDLKEVWLGEENKVRLFIDKTTFDYFIQLNNLQDSDLKHTSQSILDILPSSTVKWDGIILKVVFVGKTEIMLRSSEDDYHSFPHHTFDQLVKDKRITEVKYRPAVNKETETYKIIQKLGSSEALRIALDRYNIIKPALNGESIEDTSVCKRTHKNWLNSYEKSLAKTGNGLTGLIPSHHLKGNRIDRLEKRSEGLRKEMEEFIDTEYETNVGKTKSLSSGEFSLLCESKGIQPPSLKTFIKAINYRSSPEQIEKMKGKKMAYQEGEFIDWLNGLPIHGDRPWEFVHIDHTIVDVELIHSNKNIEMVPAWASLMFDSNPRVVPAYYLSFDPPSYRSCMGLIRECVRRHGRLPECVIVDGGKEFQSIYFEMLMARYQCDIIWRPPTKPRFGSLIERFIHTMNKEFIHNLRGNRKLMKYVRQITKEVNPKNLAIWNFPLLDLYLEKYFYDEYPNKIHSKLGQTPNDAYADAMSKYPVQDKDPIPYDDHFLIETMPSPRKKTVKLIRSRGVKFNGNFYMSKKLRRPELYGKQLEIRYDPFSYSHVYVLIDNEWVECFAPASVYSELNNKTEREIKIMTQENIALNRTLGRQYSKGLIEKAKNQAQRENTEKLEKQRLQDGEFRKSAEMRGVKLSPGRANLIENKASSIEKDDQNDEKIVTKNNEDKNQLKPFPRAINRRKRI